MRKKKKVDVQFLYNYERRVFNIYPLLTSMGAVVHKWVAQLGARERVALAMARVHSVPPHMMKPTESGQRLL